MMTTMPLAGTLHWLCLGGFHKREAVGKHARILQLQRHTVLQLKR